MSQKLAQNGKKTLKNNYNLATFLRRYIGTGTGLAPKHFLNVTEVARILYQLPTIKDLVSKCFASVFSSNYLRWLGQQESVDSLSASLNLAEGRPGFRWPNF